MSALFRRARVRLTDWAKFSPLVRAGRSAAATAKGLLTGDPAAFVKGYQLVPPGRLSDVPLKRLRTAVAAGAIPDAAVAERWERFVGSPALTRSIVLKTPGPGGERGVLLLTAEYNWVKLLAGVDDPAAFADRWTVLFSAGWSPVDYLLLGHVVQRFSGPVFVEPGNFDEVPRIEAIHPRVRCLPTICSEWINPALFRPKPVAERSIDLLMVANWAPFKRHWHFFAALRRMPAGLRVTLVGQPDGPFALARVKQQAADAGVRQRLTFVENLRVEEVYAYLCDAKATAIFSRQEGPCVAVTESLFADAPVGVLDHAHVGSKAFVNDATGVRLDPRRPDIGLMRVLRERESFRPRAWAEANVSCHVSRAKWEAFLGANAGGRPWTRGLFPFCWKPYGVYLSAADRAAAAPAVRELRERYPKLFGADFLAEAL